jgi:hypothetical protein
MPRDIRPGILTPSAAEALSDAVAQTEENRRELERQAREWPEFVAAKLTQETGIGSGSGCWSGGSGSGGVVLFCDWVEEWWDHTGARVEKPGGLFGTATWMPARTPNGESLATFPIHCILRRTLHTDCGVQWEVIAGGAGGGSRVEPGQPRFDGVTPPLPEFQSYDRLTVDIDVPSVTPVEAVWFIDLNLLP